MDEELRLWGNNIKLRRVALGMSQYDLAEAVEVRQPTVWRWEKGLAEPRRHHKARLAEVLHADVSMLFPIVRKSR